MENTLKDALAGYRDFDGYRWNINDAKLPAALVPRATGSFLVVDAGGGRKSIATALDYAGACYESARGWWLERASVVVPNFIVYSVRRFSDGREETSLCYACDSEAEADALIAELSTPAAEQIRRLVTINRSYGKLSNQICCLIPAQQNG